MKSARKYCGSSKLLAIAFCLWARACLAQTPGADSFNPEVDGIIRTLAVQSDAKILVSGDFEMVDGQLRPNLFRLNADGTLDSIFSPNLRGRDVSAPYVFSLSPMTGGKILVGGFFREVNGQAQTNLVRLTADGSLDYAFTAQATGDAEFPDGVSTLSVQMDGKILIGEGCAWCVGALVRLDSDGKKDASFFTAREDYGPQTIAMQPDGKILIGGVFSTVAGQPRTNIARLNFDGRLDAAFNPGANGPVHPIVVQADGKILVTGIFTTIAGYARTNIARLNPDGTLDTAFNTMVDSWVHSVSLQTDGKILLGGQFTTVGGHPRNGLARLNPDGSLDSEFNPGVKGWVASLAVQADGKILVGGDFTMLGGQPRTNIGRLNNTGPATQSLTYNGSTITWLRGGTSPEVWRTAFESSSDGVTWTTLGAGQRVSGGWQLTNTSLASEHKLIRAQGFVAGGGTSESMVETKLFLGPHAPPSILTADASFGVLSNKFGFMINAIPGKVIVVESSTDLLHWLPLQTNTVNAWPLYFTDPDWLLRPQQFYRARLQ